MDNIKIFREKPVLIKNLADSGDKMDPTENLYCLSKIEGCGGRRGGLPEDFKVEEIVGGRNVSSILANGGSGFKEYTHFALKKTGITTEDALVSIARELKVGRDRLTVAGQKDKNAVTIQLCSCWNGSANEKNADLDIEKVLCVKAKNIEICSAFYAEDKIRTGDLTGNSFEISLVEVKKPDRINRIMEDAGGLIPNYFGPQRFGMKGNNVKVAKFILLKKYENAVYAFLADDEKGFADFSENGISEAGLARLRKGGYEWLVAKHLLEHRGDFLGAVKRIPRAIKKLIVQSYQSHLFNLELSERIRLKSLGVFEGERACGFNEYGFIDPETQGNVVTVGVMPGYNTKANGIMSDLLWNEGVGLGDFKFRELPELASEGFERPLLINVKDLKLNRESKRNEVSVSFALPKGGYATSFLKEITSLKRN